MESFPLISSDPAILGGKPIIRGTRISVSHILELVASGGTVPDIVDAYPTLSPEAVQQALQYAAEALNGEKLFYAGVR